MSVQALFSAFRALCLTPGEKLVLLVLADHADEHLECWPSKDRLAAHTGLSVRSIYTAIRGLQRRGMVTMERQTRADGTRSTNLYRLYFETHQSANTADGGKRRSHRQNSTRAIGKIRHQPSAVFAEQNLPIEPSKINLRVRASEPVARAPAPEKIQGEAGAQLFGELVAQLAKPKGFTGNARPKLRVGSKTPEETP